MAENEEKIFNAGYKNRAARRGNRLRGKQRTIVLKGCCGSIGGKSAVKRR